MRKAKTYEVNYQSVDQAKANTRSDAQAWGRIAARLGWGLSQLENDVEAEFHDCARDAYYLKLARICR